MHSGKITDQNLKGIGSDPGLQSKWRYCTCCSVQFYRKQKQCRDSLSWSGGSKVASCITGQGTSSLSRLQSLKKEGRKHSHRHWRVKKNMSIREHRQEWWECSLESSTLLCVENLQHNHLAEGRSTETQRLLTQSSCSTVVSRDFTLENIGLGMSYFENTGVVVTTKTVQWRLSYLCSIHSSILRAWRLELRHRQAAKLLPHPGVQSQRRETLVSNAQWTTVFMQTTYNLKYAVLPSLALKQRFQGL